MHSDQLSHVYGPNTSRLLQALTAPHLDRDQRIYWLFMSTLCRPPRADEIAALAQLVPATNEPDAVAETWQADLLWALVNSTEFAMTP